MIFERAIGSIAGTILFTVRGNLYKATCGI